MTHKTVSVETSEREKKEIRKALKGSDLFFKIPPGYRQATDEEARTITEQGTETHFAMKDMQLAQAQMDAASAKLELARRDFQNALAKFQDVKKRSDKYNKETLKIEGRSGDLHTVGDKIYVLVDPPKRIEKLEDFMAPKKPDKKAKPKDNGEKSS